MEKKEDTTVHVPPFDLDEGLRLIGARGRWQILSYLAICAMYGSLAFHWQAFVFQVDTPSHHCKLPHNVSVEEAIPMKPVKDSCRMYNLTAADNSTIPCPDGWQYDPNSGYIRTVVTDFDLYCENNILVEISMMVSNAAMAVSQVFANKLADTFGRKTIFLIGCFSRATIGVAKAFSPNMIVYIILDAAAFIAMTCFASMLLLLNMELFPPEHRSFAQTTIEFAWFASVMLTSLLVYIFRDWRTLQLVMHAPVFLGLTFYWFVPESLPWLMSQQKYKQVRHNLEVGGKFNGKPIPPEFFEGKLHPEETEEDANIEAEILIGSKMSIGSTTANRRFSGTFASGPVWVKMIQSQDNLEKIDENPLDDDDSGIGGEVYGESKIIDVWKSKKMIFYTITIFLLWFTNSIVYSALSLTVTYLSGDRYLNFFLLGVAELPAIVAFHFALNRFGRRYPLCIFHIITGLSLLLTLLEVFGLAPSQFAIAMNFLGKFGVTASYCAIIVYSPELYPTNIRSIYYGTFFFWALAAQLIAPYCRPIERTIPGIVRAVCGILSLTVAVLVIFMPETFRRPLPRSLQEVENWPRNVTKEEIRRYKLLRLAATQSKRKNTAE